MPETRTAHFSHAVFFFLPPPFLMRPPFVWYLAPPPLHAPHPHFLCSTTSFRGLSAFSEVVVLEVYLLHKATRSLGFLFLEVLVDIYRMSRTSLAVHPEFAR